MSERSRKRSSLTSTRSGKKDADARRDFDGFDVDEELRRLLAAVSAGARALGMTPLATLEFAAEALGNIDEWLTRGGALPKRWWEAGSARPNDPGGVEVLAKAARRGDRTRRRRTTR